jgi:hypothetical protein
MQINLKLNYSYLALSVVASLHAPQVFAEAQQDASEQAIATIEQVEPISQDFANPDEYINLEEHAIETHEVTEVDNGAIDPVEDISNFYSDIEMRMKLAVKADAQPCSIEKCAENQAFDARVLLIGESLAKSAYALYPELKKTVPKFDFEVVDKKVLGSASNAGGKVVLFRPIQMLDLDDNAIAFIIGREMGHVIAKHHKSNAKTKIFFTVLTGVLFPAATLLSASSAAAQATTATTLMTSAASTVTSFVGSEVALSRIKPGQLSEADNISLALLEYDGVTGLDTAQSLDFIVKNENSTGWEKDLNLSIDNVRQLAGDPTVAITELEPLPDAYVETEANLAAPEVVSVEAVKLQVNKLQLPTDSQTVDSVLEKTQQEPEQKSVQPKSVEQPKIILITNQTLAESRKTKNLIPVKEKLDIKSNLKKDASNIEKTKKVAIKNIKTKKVESKKSDKHVVKTTTIKPNKATTTVVKKSSKVSTEKVVKKTDLANK